MDAHKIAVQLLMYLVIVSAIQDYRSEECYDTCELTTECIAFERSVKSQRTRCTDFLKNRCAESLFPSTCLEGLAISKHRKCPEKIMRNAISCFKCKIECDVPKPESAPAHQNNILGCVNQCEDTKSCDVSNRVGPIRMRHCKRLTEQLCSDSDDMIQCLDSIRRVVFPKCPQSFRASALSCLKCKEKCEKRLSENEGCPEKCKITKECERMSNGTRYAKRCDKITSRNCDKSLTTIQCLESLRTRGYAGCPKHIREDSIVCLKCQENCTQVGKGQEDIEDEHLHTCRTSCSKTSSCTAYKKAEPAQISKCTSMTEAFCDVTNEEDAIACLESLHEIDNAKCSKEFRNQAISCKKCEKSCDNFKVGDHSTTGKGLHDDTCEDICENSHECNKLRAASFEEIVTCTLLVEIICANGNDMLKCIEKLYQMEIQDCAVETRKNMVACMTCIADCKNIRGGSQVTLSTQASAKSNAATEYMITSVRGPSTPTLTEAPSPSSAQTSPTQTMPTEDMVTEERSPPPPMLTNSMSAVDLKYDERDRKCVEACSPKKSSITPTCMQCFRQKCEGSQDSKCIKMAIENTCLHKCFLADIDEQRNKCSQCTKTTSDGQ